MTDAFKALGSRTRVALLKLLFQKEMHLAGIARALNVSPPVVHKHVKILEENGLVERRKVGNTHVLSIPNDAMEKLRGVWWLFEESQSIEVNPGTSMDDVLKHVKGIEIRRKDNASYIAGVDGKQGYYIYEVNGKLPDKAIDQYRIDQDVDVELQRLTPVLGKKISIRVRR